MEKIYPIRFTITSGNQRKKMQYIITKQMAVEAETPEEAVAKINEGQTISLAVSLRPIQPGQALGAHPVIPQAVKS